MAISNLKCLTYFLLACSCFFATVSSLGFNGFNCGKDPILPCMGDCQRNHNANQGFCGDASRGDFACYCSPPLNSVRPLGTVDQCKFRSIRYDAICRTDCLCNHAAVDYRCDYDRHACECIGRSTDNSRCPFPTLLGLLDWLKREQELAELELESLFSRL